MSNPIRIMVWLLLAAILPVAALAESVNIAAIVNETVITSTDLNERRDLAMAFNGIEPTVENQQRLAPHVLRSLVEEALQNEEAKRLSITVSDEDVAKAVAATEEAKGQAPGSMLAFIQSHGLSKRSLEDQLRANIGWQRVVQRKLRRNVSVSDDEIARAQQTEAADPGVNELRVAAVGVPVRKPEDTDKAAQLAGDMSREVAAGTPLSDIAVKYAKQDISISPPHWVKEESLPAGLQQALRALKAGDVTPPMRNPEGFQLMQLMDRRTTKPLPDATEVVVKDIAIPAPSDTDKGTMEAVRQQAIAVHANPGSCTEDGVGVPDAKVDTKYVRTQVSQLSQDVRSVVDHLGVGDVSEPMITPRAIHVVMLCEKVEPVDAAVADADKIRDTLFKEKLELEAAKHMRDLKRDAFIDIKGANAT